MMTRSTCLLVVALAGCGPVITVSPLNAPPRPLGPRPPTTVQLFASHVPPGVVDVYLIEASGGATGSRLSELRARAGALGCDGLVINSSAPDVQSQSQLYYPGRIPATATSTTEGYVSAVCFVFPGLAAAPGAP